MKVPKQFLRQLDHGGATTYYDARSRKVWLAFPNRTGLAETLGVIALWNLTAPDGNDYYYSVDRHGFHDVWERRHYQAD